MPGLRRLYARERVAVRTDHRGVPLLVEGKKVEGIREEWLVDVGATAAPLLRAGA